MVWLANVFAGLVGSIAVFFGLQLTKKLTFILAALAAFLALTGTFVAVVHGLIFGLAYTLPGWAGNALVLVPSNLPACLGAYISAKVARWIYDYHVQGLKIASYIT